LLIYYFLWICLIFFLF
jgi:large subunit ribosomal protein L6e